MTITCVSSPKEHLIPSRTHIKNIQSLLENLDPLPIVFFCYIRIFPNGVATGLYSEPEPVQEALERGIFHPLFDDKGSVLPEGYYFSNDIQELLYSKKDRDSMSYFLDTIRDIQQRSQGAWDNGFFIVKKNKLYDEMFYFFANVPTEKHRFFFLNNSDTLNHFCLYFLSESKEMIRYSMQYAYRYPVVKQFKGTSPTTSLSDISHQKLKGNMLVNRYRFIFQDMEVFLTPKEFNCLKMLADSEKASKTAETLGISIKGYESTVQRIKDKFNVSEKKDLVRIYLDSLYS